MESLTLSNFFCDWFSFTYKNDAADDLLSEFWELFPELTKYRDEMVIVGGRNFSHGLCLDGDFTIRYDDWNNGKGVNVEIPSHGLQHFISLFDVKDLVGLFRLVRDRNCLPSRLDLTLDDYTMTYKPSYYYKKFLSGAMVTNMRVCSMNHSGKDKDGETFYLGDRRKRMIRIYNKDVQSDGEIKAIRYEIELHANAAAAVFLHFCDSKEVVHFGDLLLSIFDIRVVNKNDTNKTRWKNNERWYSFVKSTFSQSTIQIQPYNPESQVKSILEHAEHNASSVGFMAAIHGWDAVISAIHEKGFKPEYIKAIKGYARNNDINEEHFLKLCLDNFYNKRKKGVNLY